MSIADLILHVGSEHVVLQNLAGNLENAQVRKGNGLITFTTEPSKVADLMRNEESEWVGLIVWLPRARLPQIQFKGGKE